MEGGPGNSEASLKTRSTTRQHSTGATDHGAQECDVRTALGVTTTIPRREMERSGMAVVKG